MRRILGPSGAALVLLIVAVRLAPANQGAGASANAPQYTGDGQLKFPENYREWVYLSSGLHRGGEGSLADLDWTKRRWDPARAYAESKLHVVALAFALARRWPQVLSNEVDPGWARTKMGGPGAPVDLDTGQRTQTWLAVSDEPTALVSGRYWHHLRQEQPASEAADPEFQDLLIASLSELTGVALPKA